MAGSGATAATMNEGTDNGSSYSMFYVERERDVRLSNLVQPHRHALSEYMVWLRVTRHCILYGLNEINESLCGSRPASLSSHLRRGN